MEGVGSEAASLAGHLGLDDLCWIYDNNHITIDGKTSITFTEDVAARFRAYQWNVLHVADANDLESIADALAVFRKTKDRPTLIILDSHIGYGSPHKVDTSAAHGEPLGEDEVRLVKRAYHWPEDAKFLVPDGVDGAFRRRHRPRGAQGATRMGSDVRRISRRIPRSRDRDRPDAAAGVARRMGSQSAELSRRTRKASPGATRRARCSMFSAQNIPWFMGGSADLASSNRTALKFPGAGDFEPGSPSGRNLHFGIREHAMTAIVNGLSLSKLRAYRLDIPRVHRLRAAGHSALGNHGAADHFGLHA